MEVKDFAAERQQEVAEVLAYLSRAIEQPFRGMFAAPGMPRPLIGASIDSLSESYRDGILGASFHWGAVPAFTAAPADNDIVQVVATITEETAGDTHPNTVIEACAEVLRVLLAGAIITAKECCREGDEVWLAFRNLPHFVVSENFANGRIHVAGRLRGIVALKSQPAGSFILGGGQKLDYRLPETLFAGPSRLRFLDQRSPGHLVHEELIRVSA